MSSDQTFATQLVNSIHNRLPDTGDFNTSSQEWIEMARSISEIADALYPNSQESRDRFIDRITGLGSFAANSALEQ